MTPPDRHPRFRTIIAGSDGRRGRGAVALAQVIASATDARLLLIAVERELPLPLIETHAQLRAALTDGLHGVRDRYAPKALAQVAVDASPAHALRQIAKDEHADLIVVGSRARNLTRRLASSNRAMQVLHGAPCAVAVAPDGARPCTRLTRIGVGFDGSPESDVALDMALELARATGANVELLAVADDVYPGPTEFRIGGSYDNVYGEILDAREHAAQAVIAAGLEGCSGVPARGKVHTGGATQELIALSSSCDLLVLGSRRWGPLRRLALGSTSERVIRNAACPVLVPPRGAGGDHDNPTAAAVTAAGAR